MNTYAAATPMAHGSTEWAIEYDPVAMDYLLTARWRRADREKICYQRMFRREFLADLTGPSGLTVLMTYLLIQANEEVIGTQAEGEFAPAWQPAIFRPN